MRTASSPPDSGGLLPGRRWATSAVGPRSSSTWPWTGQQSFLVRGIRLAQPLRATGRRVGPGGHRDPDDPRGDGAALAACPTCHEGSVGSARERAMPRGLGLIMTHPRCDDLRDRRLCVDILTAPTSRRARHEPQAVDTPRVHVPQRTCAGFSVRGCSRVYRGGSGRWVPEVGPDGPVSRRLDGQARPSRPAEGDIDGPRVDPAPSPQLHAGAAGPGSSAAASASGSLEPGCVARAPVSRTLRAAGVRV
jgi:hypothetical protein